VCGGCFYAEVELNKDIVEVEDTVSLAESTVNNIDKQVLHSFIWQIANQLVSVGWYL